MKRISLIICAISIAVSSFCQPDWTKKAAKSVFTLKTFSLDGSMIASTNGFFIGQSGEAVSNLAPFVGASRAVVIDAQGKELPVECMLGANETYDVVKFRVASKRTVPLAVSEAAAANGTKVWLMPYTTKKTPECIEGKISKSEQISNGYTYYTISTKAPADAVSSPFFNENGEVVGMMQLPTSGRDTMSYAVSAKLAADLKITGLSINDPTLKSIQIKKDLPDNVSDAVLTLYVAGATLDSATYSNLVNDFIAKFPDSADGYIYRAQAASNAGMFADAERDMAQAIKVAEKKDDAHYNYARLIFQKELYQADKPYVNWTLDKAVSEAEEAYRINPMPIYKQLKAQILFTKKDYDSSYNTYKEMIDGGAHTADVYFEAARCKEMLKDTTAMLALLDSTVNTFSRPYLKEAAPYILARASAYSAVGKYRQAVNDFNDYESLMSSSLNDNFYYIREQVEVECRMYQQALNDITKAIELSPKNTLYYAEKASLEVRVGLFDEAIATSRECIDIAPKLSDGYLFLGLAQCLKGDKPEGIKNLEKAKELGAEQAQELIEKYK